MRVHVCICVLVCACMCVCVYVCCMGACVCVCACVCVHAYMSVCVHACAHVCACVCMCMLDWPFWARFGALQIFDHYYRSKKRFGKSRGENHRTWQKPSKLTMITYNHVLPVKFGSKTPHHLNPPPLPPPTIFKKTWAKLVTRPFTAETTEASKYIYQLCVASWTRLTE